MFQQRHFEAIATMMQDLQPVDEPDAFLQWLQTRAALGRLFMRENPRFDVGRFERACEPGANVRKRSA
jgi:predicted thioredoxin/glutaredoxin